MMSTCNQAPAGKGQPRRKLLLLGMSLFLTLAGGRTLGQSLPGFTLTGENWTCDPGDGGAVITGILSKPSTNGPLPEPSR
jgi:hypothetical protein